MQEAISLGWNCESAFKGVAEGIRKVRADGYKTCPFDECITNYEGIIECIKDDFKYLCDVNYLKLVPARFSTGGIVESERLIHNTRYNFIFNHESPAHAKLWSSQGWPGGKMHYIDNNYAMFIERYSRRIDNFRNYVKNNSIRFIIGNFRNEVDSLRDTITRTYPTLTFDIYHYRPSVSKKLFNEHHALMNIYTEHAKKYKCTVSRRWGWCT